MPIHVSSEIGPLRAVLVHEPGNEVLAVTPGTRRDFLYDDIIELDTARTEHRSMVAVLRRFAEVYEVGDLLRHIAESEDARKLLAAQTEHIAYAGNVSKLLADRPADDLVTMLIQGAEDVAGPIARTLNQGGYALPPLPNLFFTRDVGIVIGGHAVIGSMRHEARWSEELLIKALFACHPVLENDGIIYDGSEERRLGYTLEGGDVHPVREDLLIVGFSDRTSAMALDHLCDIAMARCGISDVIVVVMPGEPTAVHLDMLFTQIDHGLCVVSPPQFIGPQRLAVLHRRKGKAGVREMPDFFAALKILVDQCVDFRVSIIGEQFREYPAVFDSARDEFKDHISRWGYQAWRSEYVAALAEADVFVSTANHEFFGISVVEAIAAGAYPLLPERLSYPEILQGVENAAVFFYDGSPERLAAKLSELAGRVADGDLWCGTGNEPASAVDRFRWEWVAPDLDWALSDALAK